MDVSQDQLAQLAAEMELDPAAARQALDVIVSAMSTRTLPDAGPRSRSMSTAFARWATDHPLPR